MAQTPQEAKVLGSASCAKTCDEGSCLTHENCSLEAKEHVSSRDAIAETREPNPGELPSRLGRSVIGMTTGRERVNVEVAIRVGILRRAGDRKLQQRSMNQ